MPRPARGCRCLATPTPSGRRALDAATKRVVVEAKEAYIDAIRPPEDFGKVYHLRKLQWRASQPLFAVSLCKVLRAVRAYNDFSPTRVCKWISRPKYVGVSWTFGRENSPVLYATGDVGVLKALARSAKRSGRADEVNIRADGSLRLWWD